MENEQLVASNPVNGSGWVDRLREKKLWAHPITQNLLAISLVQAGNNAVPLLTVPYLTRVLGPNGWGLFGFAQSFAISLGLVAEYGFWLSASREIARHRDDRPLGRSNDLFIAKQKLLRPATIGGLAVNVGMTVAIGGIGRSTSHRVTRLGKHLERARGQPGADSARHIKHPDVA